MVRCAATLVYLPSATQSFRLGSRGAVKYNSMATGRTIMARLIRMVVMIFSLADW